MLLTSLLSVLAPHDCLVCGEEGALLCVTCRDELKPATPRCYRCHRYDDDWRTCRSCRSSSDVYRVRALVSYEGAGRDLIWKLKFGRAHAAAAEIAGMLSGQLPASVAPLIITHVPTAPTRVRQRGYDQARLIARTLAKQNGLPYTPLLARMSAAKQIGASRAKRTSQLAGAFRPLHTASIKDAHIILVDDVATTGATLEAAARTLKRAGAGRVEAIVFAQA